MHGVSHALPEDDLGIEPPPPVHYGMERALKSGSVALGSRRPNRQQPDRSKTFFSSEDLRNAGRADASPAPEKSPASRRMAQSHDSLNFDDDASKIDHPSRSRARVVPDHTDRPQHLSYTDISNGEHHLGNMDILTGRLHPSNMDISTGKHHLSNMDISNGKHRLGDMDISNVPDSAQNRLSRGSTDDENPFSMQTGQQQTQFLKVKWTVAYR
jgi:hypothetical protein